MALKRIAQVSAVLALIAAAGALGRVVYTASKDPVVVEMKQHYEKKAAKTEAELKEGKEALAKQRDALEKEYGERFSSVSSVVSNQYLAQFVSLSNSFNTNLTALSNAYVSNISSFSNSHIAEIAKTVNNYSNSLATMSNSFYLNNIGVRKVAESREKELELEKKKLEQTFFAPLTNLTDVPADKLSLTPLERQLYADFSLTGGKSEIWTRPEKNETIYDAVVDGKVRVVGQKSGLLLMIWRYDTRDDGLLSANLYSYAPTSTNLQQQLDGAALERMISFNNSNEVRSINYRSNNLSSIANGRVFYQSDNSEVLLPYTTAANNLLKEFKILTLRGPGTAVQYQNFPSATNVSQKPSPDSLENLKSK